MKKAGYLVETKTGKTGRTYHHEKKVNGKTIVHVDGEDLKLLSNTKTLKIIGYFDEEENEH